MGLLKDNGLKMRFWRCWWMNMKAKGRVIRPWDATSWQTINQFFRDFTREFLVGLVTLAVLVAALIWFALTPLYFLVALPLWAALDVCKARWRIDSREKNFRTATTKHPEFFEKISKEEA